MFEELPDRTYTQRPARYGDIAILLEARTNLSFTGGPRQERRAGLRARRHRVLLPTGSIRPVQPPPVTRAPPRRYQPCRDPPVPTSGASHTELFRIAQEHGWTLWKKLNNYAENSGSVTSLRARDLLAKWENLAGRTALVPLIRQILSDSGVYTVYAALPEGKQILANLEKIVAMARVREEAGGYELADFTSNPAGPRWKRTNGRARPPSMPSRRMRSTS